MFVKVKVNPGAKKEAIEQVSAHVYRVAVKEPAKQGRANKRLREVMAEYLKLPLSRVRLISGHHHSSKMFEVDDET